MSQAWLGRVAGLAQPCRKPGPTVSWPSVATRPRTLLRALSSCILCCIIALLRCKKFCIATSASQAMHAHALPHAPRVGRPCRGLYRGPTTPCRGHGMTVSQASSVMSWPSPSLSMCAPAPPPCLACHNTVCCIVTQTKKIWAVAHSMFPAFFFFRTIFFLIPTIGKPPKKNIIYFFSFSSRTKNIYFKYCFPILHIVKHKKKMLNAFLFHLILDYLPKIPQQFVLTLKPSVQHFFFVFFSYVLFTKHKIHSIHNTQSHITQQSSNSQWMHDLLVPIRP